MKWFSNPGIPASVMEARIMKILKKLKIIYFREVSFRNFLSPRGYPYRYDFYFPDRNLIIEYDGSHHIETRVKKNDNIKNKYCKKKKIKLIRLNKKNFKTLEKDLKKIFNG